MEKHIADLKEILTKGPVQILGDYYKLLEVINSMISASEHKDTEIAKAAGLSLSQLYRRKSNPELWKKKELLKLFKLFNIKE
jgi:DNA invertase Pin-like site-specific DNA recombinase